MRKSYLLVGVTAGLLVSRLVSADNPAVIPQFLTPEVNSPPPATATLNGCAATAGEPITISWNASTTAQINLTPSVDVAAGMVEENIKMLLTLAGETLLDVASPDLGGSCASCSKDTGPIAQAADTTFSAPGVQAVFSNSLVVNPGNPIYDALAGGGSATLSFDPQGQSSVINWGPNVQGGVATVSAAQVSCQVSPPPPPPPPPPVPAIGALGIGVLGLGLSGLGVMLGFRRRRR